MTEILPDLKVVKNMVIEKKNLITQESNPGLLLYTNWPPALYKNSIQP